MSVATQQGLMKPAGGVRAPRSANVLPAAAMLGGLLAVFEIYIVTKWVTGPNFRSVPVGPSDLETWRKAVIIGAEIITPPIALYLVYRYLVRPWRREKRVTFEGLVCIAAPLSCIYDASSGYYVNWITYNSFFVNRGNPSAELPGWQSFHAPGQQPALSILWYPFIYIIVILAVSGMGCWVMRTARARWPKLPTAGLLALCYLSIIAFDFALEIPVQGLHWLGESGPAAFGIIPIDNIILVTFLFTLFAALRYFRDDRGQTFVERGAERVTDQTKSIALRALAVLAGIQLILFGGYHVPKAVWTKYHVHEWPAKMTDNSWFNNGICGTGTNRSCPPELKG